MSIRMQARLYSPITTAACLLLLATVLGLQCHQAEEPLAAYPTVVSEASADPGTAMDPSDDLVELARRDPIAFLDHCWDEYDRRNVQDYTCTFTKQELVGNRLTAVQEAAVRFREKPFSVDMKWTKNPTAVKRALYVENAMTDRQGRELAWFKPAGALIGLFVPKIKQPIHGPRAKAAARRTMDQFGFRRTLDLIIEYTRRGREDGVLELEYVGEGSIAGRPTLVFERRLPFTGEEEPYPDGLLRYQIDREWLVPTSCFSYADHDGQKLLGSYVLTAVQFNVGLSDDDFDPRKIGF